MTLRLLALAVLLLLPGCTSGIAGSPTPPVAGGASGGSGSPTQPLASKASQVRFMDATESSGIRFVHDNGGFGKKWMPETTGGGCAFLDYDGDGRQDLLFVNSGRFNLKDPAPATAASPSRVALYRNNGDGTFSDTTTRAHLGVDHYGQGVCVADFDNDGWEDVYITCIGPNYLFHNNGDGTFTDITKKARVEGKAVGGSLRWKWSSACTWTDYDKDGWLDLFVGNFVQWSPDLDVFCGSKGGVKDYCAPMAYQPLPNTLYHNNRNGTFTDVSAQTRIGEYLGKAWGVTVLDYNGDDWPDLAVSNDTEPNSLFANHGGKYFTEEGAPSGIALSESGHAKAGMGIDVADWNNDGRFSLLIGNFSNEKLSLFRDEGDGLMRDVADETGVGEPSLPFLTFGLCFLDCNLDGWQDIFAANGHIQELVQQMDSGITFKERPLLYLNQRNGKFAEVGTQAGEPLQHGYVLRGCAYGDTDNDGDLDLVTVENNGKARLWKNETSGPGHWIRFRLRGKRSNRSGIGAQLIVRSGGVTQRRWVKSGASFLSQSELRATFGLGEATGIEEVKVLWPAGGVESHGNLTGGQEYVITEGQGCVPAPRR